MPFEASGEGGAEGERKILGTREEVARAIEALERDIAEAQRDHPLAAAAAGIILHMLSQGVHGALTMGRASSLQELVNVTDKAEQAAYRSNNEGLMMTHRATLTFAKGALHAVQTILNAQRGK